MSGRGVQEFSPGQGLWVKNSNDVMMIMVEEGKTGEKDGYGSTESDNYSK